MQRLELQGHGRWGLGWGFGSLDLAPERCWSSSASTLSRGPGAGWARLLGSLGTAVPSHSLLPAAPCRPPFPHLHRYHELDSFCCPAIRPGYKGAHRTATSPCGVYTGEGLWGSQRALGTFGSWMPRWGLLLVVLSSCTFRLHGTPEPSDSDSGRGGWRWHRGSPLPNTPDFQICDVISLHTS